LENIFIWIRLGLYGRGEEGSLLFAVVSASFFLDGVLFSLVPTTIFLLPDLAQNAAVIFAVNSIAFILGAAALGRLGDVVGRDWA
jgi:MFS family permease